MSNEIHPAVEANNVQARRNAEANDAQARLNAEAFSEATKKAVAEATAFAAAVKLRRKKRATTAMLTRVAVAFLSIILLKTLRTFDHLSAEVAVTGTLFLVCWLGIWVGAWLQFMYGKEGLLR